MMLVRKEKVESIILTTDTLGFLVLLCEVHCGWRGIPPRARWCKTLNAFKTDSYIEDNGLK